MPPPLPHQLVPVHNQTASIASLAKTMLMSVDRKQVETTVQTESLVLILSTFLTLASRGADQQHVEPITRSMKELVSAVETAQRERQAREASERDKFHMGG